MKIAIRMDDITPHMDWEKFNRFRDLLEEFGIKPLIGVVPDNQDDNLNKEEGNVDAFWQQVRLWQEQGWIIALHGHQHVYQQEKGGCFPLNLFSEFAGLGYEEQQEKLSRGKQIFLSHGIKTDIFMAPAHSYDKNTLRALKELGISKITEGFGSTPYIWKGITFYPIPFKISSSLKKSYGTTTMVIHTNTMQEEDFTNCRSIFETQEMISYEEYLRVPAVNRGMYGHAAEYIMATVKRFLVKLLS